MRYEDIDNSLARSLRKQLAVALLSCVVLVAGFGGVAAYSQISGAVIGSGKIIVQGRTKAVQHPDGGIIGSILVKEDQKVEAGQTLFVLDDTRVRASLDVIESQLDQLLVQEARLLVELGQTEELAMPAEIGDRSNVQGQFLVDGQMELMQARAATRESRKAQLREQISQFAEQVTALTAQSTAVNENISLLDEQIGNYNQLHEKGLATGSQLAEMRREMASLVGSQAALSAQLVEVDQATSLAKLQLVQVDEDFREALLTELDIKRTEIARLRGERVGALDRLDRLEIKSPITGHLHELVVHTVGGIIAPGQTLVSVIPVEEELVVEAKLSPMDVDQVTTGQLARIRLTGLNQRLTPEVFAEVTDVSADLTTDQVTGASYYLATLSFSEAELDKLSGQMLRPGMPAEVFVETSSRTVLSYLVKPISDQIQHAMREN